MADVIIEEEEEVAQKSQRENGLREKKFSWRQLVRFDSFDVETAKIPGNHSRRSQVYDWGTILKLAFQSIGVVYGDLGTSPLYVIPSVFPNGIKKDDNILGVMSLIIYTLTLITLIKYVFIVLSANDNGDGGTFALYSLICRNAKVSLIPNQQPEDSNVSSFRLEVPDRRLNRASRVKSILESSQFAKYALLFITMLGTSMVIGDGILTPCISVLSAVGGLKEAEASNNLTEGTIMWISVAILIFLFQVQRLGTNKVGYIFAPILTTWFVFIGSIGVYNFAKHDPGVIKALNPKYIVDYFARNGKDAWVSLGGVVLCLTGSEALFADLGHFTVRSIQISACSVVLPSIVAAYFGQASYLRKHSDQASNAFYSSVPKPMYWPMFVVAVLAAIIASQSLISGAFSIIQQSLALGCFPRVKVVHTSAKYEGQVFIPEVNNLLMVACVAVTLGFKNTIKIGNAYGIAVVFVMTLTSALLVLVMILIWKTNFFLITLYIAVISSVELLYLSSVLYKFDQGGYLPLAFSAFLMTVMYVWNYVYRKKYMYELENKISVEKLKEIASDPNIHRIPGLALFYSGLVHGIPPIFTHYIANVPAVHSVLLFVTIKSLPISKVPTEERFLFRRVEPCDLVIFRCIVRYGYTDLRNERDSFEGMLMEQLMQFIRADADAQKSMVSMNDVNVSNVAEMSEAAEVGDREVQLVERAKMSEAEEVGDREVQLVEREGRTGVTYLLGEVDVVAQKRSSLVKRVMINYAYNWVRRCVRDQEEVFGVPHKRLLKVGMTYEL